MYPELEDPTAAQGLDPYAEWKGGEFIPVGSSFQATPSWWQPKGPFSIGPFSGPPGFQVDDLRTFWAPQVPTSIDQNTIHNPSTADNASLYQAYSYSLAGVTAPGIPTSGSHC